MSGETGKFSSSSGPVPGVPTGTVVPFIPTLGCIQGTRPPWSCRCSGNCSGRTRKTGKNRISSRNKLPAPGHRSLLRVLRSSDRVTRHQGNRTDRGSPPQTPPTDERSRPRQDAPAAAQGHAGAGTFTGCHIPVNGRRAFFLVHPGTGLKHMRHEDGQDAGGCPACRVIRAQGLSPA